MRLLAIPSRTPRFGSLCFLKKMRSAVASASGSRSSPATTIPGSSSSRTTCSTCAWPLLTTFAAASCDAPTLRPTSRFGSFRAAAFASRRFSAFGVFGFGARSAFGLRSRFGFAGFSAFGFRSFGGLGAFGGLASFGLRLNEISFLNSEVFGPACRLGLLSAGATSVSASAAGVFLAGAFFFGSRSENLISFFKSMTRPPRS